MENTITSDDELRAENELLKLKLEIEHGMTDSSGTSHLPASIENQWLNYIYNYEKVCKDAGKVSVIDYIGNPSYQNISELMPAEVPFELDRLMEMLFAKDIMLDFICEYPDEIKYKFITEELFLEEFYNIRMEGVRTCFTYEEFHPNHDYDLRRHSEDFLKWLFTKTWTEDCAKYEMTATIRFQHKEYDGYGISQIILTFQEEAKKFEVKNKLITEVRFDMNEYKGYVKIALSYEKYWKDGTITQHTGDCYLHFESEFGGWSLSEFSLPGLGS